MIDMEDSQIRELEMIGHNAWLAEEKMRLGGWILRADHGVTRRANSVLPLESPNLPLPLAIEYATEFYQSRELIPRFQMTNTSQPQGLDEFLSDTGFSVGLQVEIWTAPISALLNISSTFESIALPQVTPEWIDIFNRGSGHEQSTIDTRKAIMERTQHPHSFIVTMIDGVPASVGFGVVERPWLGVFSIATVPEFRNRGAASSVNRELGLWAQDLGAESAYLQVEINNQTAKKLYSKLGFSYAYKYWYRDLE